MACTPILQSTPQYSLLFSGCILINFLFCYKYMIIKLKCNSNKNKETSFEVSFALSVERYEFPQEGFSSLQL